MGELGEPMDKDIDLAIAAFTDRRSEIRDRLGYRDQWLSRYVFGVVAFLGVSLGIEKLDPDMKIILCLVMPVTSLIVAINVSAHVRGVEDCANYLRGPLNDFFVRRDAWAPHWDWETSTKRKSADGKEKTRNARRRWANILSLHFPSIVSLGVAALLIGERYAFVARWSFPPVVILFAVAIGFVAAAILETWNSFEDRIKNTIVAATPPDLPEAKDRLKPPADTADTAATTIPAKQRRA